MKKYFITLLFQCVLITLATATITSTPRKTQLLDKWYFTEDKDSTSGKLQIPDNQSNWSLVQIPHIFRQSGLRDNTAGWYRCSINADKTNGRYLLILEGATAIKDVFVNGIHIGQHKSAYTASAFDLTPAIKPGQNNSVVVRVSNRDSEIRGVMVRSSLYFNNGGMFRKAWLVRTGGPVYIYPEMGASGLFVTPRILSKDHAELNIRTVLRNTEDKIVHLNVVNTITDPSGKVVTMTKSSVTLNGTETYSANIKCNIKNPVLWDLRKAKLYKVYSEVQVDGKAVDGMSVNAGFRTIAWDGKQFTLNGKVVQLHGVNKHAQDEYVWNAMPDQNLQQEWNRMLDMGVNAVRLAHYPHSSLEYSIADAKGIAVWAENGFAGHNWQKIFPEDRVPTPDGERITREMVLQNWNHPSILFWSAGNETVAPTAAHYASVIRSLNDPNRLITYASSGEKPDSCDFIAFNTYHGWYYGDYNAFKKGNELVSETGAGDWISHHVPYGTAKWKVNEYEPEEYAEIFTEFRLQTICRNDIEKHPMFLWWNFREFYDKKFKMNRNTKGLETLAGQPKDLAFLFKAFFAPDKPLVHLNGRYHFFRTFDANNGIKAYANVPQLELFINGKSRGKLKNGVYRIPDVTVPEKDKDGNKTEKTIPGIEVANVFFWKTPLHEGKNIVEVKDGKGHNDHMVIYQHSEGKQMPADPHALVQDLKSSNPLSPAWYIDSPVEPQSPVYTEVDGSSDNTFDRIPDLLKGACRIATRRLSDEKNKTAISFRINKKSPGAVVCVMLSKGTYPTITLKQDDKTIMQTASELEATLASKGFTNTKLSAVWRDNDLNRTYAAIWIKKMKPGETFSLPETVLDYVIMLKK